MIDRKMPVSTLAFMTQKKIDDISAGVSAHGGSGTPYARLTEGEAVRKGEKTTAPQNLVLPKPTAAPKAPASATKDKK
jgi:hypothetical protein